MFGVQNTRFCWILLSKLSGFELRTSVVASTVVFLLRESLSEQQGLWSLSQKNKVAKVVGPFRAVSRFTVCSLSDYYYVSREEFLRMKENREFIETTEFSANFYATSKRAVSEVLEAGRMCVLDVDMQGVKNVKSLGIPATFVFVKPPSLPILVRDTNSATSEFRFLKIRSVFRFFSPLRACETLLESAV